MKIIKACEVPNLIKNGDFLAIDGFVGVGVPEEILLEIEKKFLSEGHPNKLSLMFAAGFGDGKQRGLNRIAHKGLIKRVIGGHWGLAPGLGQLANDEAVEGYNFPQGVIAQMFRDMAGKKPRTISRVGLGTFVDPDLQGGKLNSITKEDLVEKVNIDGNDYLMYKTQKIDVAILRGTSADRNGNISYEKEALKLEGLNIAMAAKNHGGKVIVQVERIVDKILTKDIQIPGIFVDHVVVSKPENHMQTFAEQYTDLFVNNNNVLQENDIAPIKLDERKIIARRSALTLTADKKILNYGIGMPEVIAAILREERQEKNFIPTVEPGAIGGTPMGGLSFGAAVNPECIISQPEQFDFYDGGGLDAAFLGLAQCDEFGNINVSKFGPKIAGCGGFINITQNAKEVIFCGTFTAGGLKVAVDNGKLIIEQEGKIKKFIKNVEQITFSGKLAQQLEKKVLYITERAVFELKKEGLTLIEIAPGVDLEKDILNQMEFKPVISEDLKVMDQKIYEDKLMNLVI